VSPYLLSDEGLDGQGQGQVTGVFVLSGALVFVAVLCAVEAIRHRHWMSRLRLSLMIGASVVLAIAAIPVFRLAADHPQTRSVMAQWLGPDWECRHYGKGATFCREFPPTR
jgi:hypothetical protein